MADEELSHIEAGIMQELWLGGSSGWSMFADEAELKAAWEKYRPQVMAMFARDGLRPAGWWRYDAPIPYPGDERERSALYEAGVVTGDEKAELELNWRAEFEQAYAPGYGADRRRKHFRDCDIPRELVRKWTAERKRRSKAIKKFASKQVALGPAQEVADPRAR
jgi:hypothetical protein